MTSNSKRIVLGVIGNDTHVVANRIIDLGLKDAGFQTCNIGTNNIPQDFAAAALETSAHAVLVSSINGEGEHWCVNFRRHFIHYDMDNILLYIGGNLVVGDREPNGVIRLFENYGFNRVFYRTGSISSSIKTLAEDLMVEA